MNCPHCKGAGISGLATRWSSREFPAKCGLCAGLSYVAHKSNAEIPAFSAVIVLLSTILGVAVNHVLAGALAGLPFAIAYNVWAWRRVEMTPISAEAAAKARRVGWFVAALILLGIFAR